MQVARSELKMIRYWDLNAINSLYHCQTHNFNNEAHWINTGVACDRGQLWRMGLLILLEIDDIICGLQGKMKT